MRRIVFSLMAMCIIQSMNAQSFRTPTFTGNSSDFTAAERFASVDNVDYYVTYDATFIYFAAFRTNNNTWGQFDHFTIYVDNIGTGTGSSTGVNWDSNTPSLPIAADYRIAIRRNASGESFFSTFAGSWTTGATNGQGWTQFTTASTNGALEVRVPWTDLGSPDAIRFNMYASYNTGFFGAAPGGTSGSAPSTTNYFGSIGTKSADCVPTNTTNLVLTSAMLTNAVPAAAGVYARVIVNSGTVTNANNWTLAPGGIIEVSGGTLAFGAQTITMGNAATSTGRGTTINTSGAGAITTAATTVFDAGGELAITGNALSMSGSFRIRNKFTPLAAGATTIASGGSLDIRAGGFVSTNALTYASGSFLKYNTGNTYVAASEWTANVGSGTGVPSNVTIGDLVTASVCSFGTTNQYRQLTGNLLISAANTLALSTTIGGDLRIGGNWTNSGTFTSNSRSVNFNGTTAQTINALATFAFLTISNTAGVTCAATTPLTITSNLTIDANCRLDVGANNLTMTGATSAVNGFLRMGGNVAAALTLTGVTSTTLTITSTGTYEHNFSGTAGGAIPNATWQSGSTVAVIGVAGGTTAPTNLGQSFSNFTWNCTNQTSAMNLSGGLTTVTGNFNCISTGTTGSLRFTGATTHTMNVTGNFNVSGGSLIFSTGAGASTINITGNLNISGGTFNTNSGGSGIQTINLNGGNFNQTGGVFTRTSGLIGQVSFNNTSVAQTINQSGGGTITGATGMNFNIATGATLRFISNVNFGTATGGTISTNGGTIDFQTFVASGAINFWPATNARIITANTDAGGALNQTGAVGSVQVTGTRTFTSAGLDYTFNGAAAQVTGTGIGQATNIRNLVINNAAGLTLSAATTVAATGSVTFTSGSLRLSNFNLTLTTGATLTGVSSSQYFVTNGTGALVRTVGATSVSFPVGNSAYNPISFANTGTSDTYAIRVADGAITSPNDATKTINRSWIVTEGTAGGGSITPVLTFNSGEENNAGAWSAAVNPFVGMYTTAWSQVAATAAGSNPFTYTANLPFTPSVASYTFAAAKDDGLTAPILPPTITGISVAAPGSGANGYVGTTVTVTGTNLASVTIVRVGGVGGTAVTIASQSSTTLTFTAINLSGQIYVENSSGGATSAATYTNLGYITNANGVYTTAATWLGNAVPPAASNVTIADVVTLASAANAAGNMTINAASSFTINNAAGAITVNNITNNGTLASGAAGTITIAASGILTNNSVANMAAGAVVYAGAGTVNGSAATSFFNLTLNGGLTVTTVPTVNNNLTLNSGAFLTAALTYGATSTLIYNTTGTYGVSNEWTGNATTAGLGIPQNVTIQNTTTVTFPTTNRGCAGNFTITTGGATLNATSGDLYVAGNFVHNGSSFTTSGRAVFFNGAAAQAISGSAAALSFDYLILNNNSVSGVTLNRSASVVATTGDALQLLGSGPLNIGTANSVLTLSGNGGNVLVNGGARTINLLLLTNFIDFTGTKTVVSAGGGTLTIAGVTAPSGARLSAGVNFGAGLTTIANNTYLTILAGGFVNTNAVTYASGSTLAFSSGASYVVGSTDRTWGPGTSGAGVPFNVLINAAGTDVVISDNRTMNNNLTITAGTLTNNTNTLNIGPSGGGNKVLTVNGGTLTNNGGTINHNGNVSMTTGTFNMNGGTFMVDGNDGTSGTSVASGTNLFAINAAVTNTGVSGGTILINDPPFAGAGASFIFLGSAANAIWTGNTLQLGGSTGTNASTATNGFNVDTYAGTVNLRLGNVIVDGGSGASRFASAPSASANGFDVSGTLTINANSELRTLAGGPDIRVSGNVVNNGTMTIVSGTALNFSTRIGGTVSANSVAQTVTGTGVFRNAVASPTANFAELIINNTGGVSFNVGAISVSETVTFTAGVLDIGTANDFVLVGTATQTRTTGYLVRDATAAGYMKRTHSTTGSHTYHIGNGGVYAPITLNFTVNSVSRQMGVSVVDATHPDMNNPVAAVDYHSKYWRLFESAAGGSYSFTAALTYNLAGDVNGTEASIRVSGWDGTAWTEYGAGSVASPVITSATITQTNAPTLNNLVLSGRRNPTIIYTWTGGANTTNWADATNWSPNGVPASTDAVLINNAATFNLNLTDARTVNSLTLTGTGVLNVSATGSLTVNGAVTYANTATANLACGSTVSFASATALTIPAWTYGNLTITGGARTWTSGATTTICGNLTTGSVAQTATGSIVAFTGTAAQSITGNATFETCNITNTSATVSSGSNITVNGALNVNANATFHSTAGTLTLGSVSVSVINGTLRRTGSLTQAGATVTVSGTGTYDHNSNGGALLTATWSSGSTCLISGSTANGPSSGLGQAFHHLTWNCPGQTSTIGLAGAITTVNGNLSFLSTGSSGATLNLTGTTTYTLAIGGNLVINAATGINTKVNLTSSTGVATINLLGNFDLSDTGTGVAELSKTGSGAGSINFRRVGAPLALAQQNYTQNGGVILNAIAFVVGGAGPTYSHVQLQTDAALGSNATMSVTSGSAIEFQTFILTGPSFVLNNGGNLITANVNGITALGNVSGSVQTTTTRTFNASCNFTYNGTSAQVTGNGLPATANYLGISNAAGVSLTSPITLTSPGGLLFNTGTLSLGNNNLTLGAGVGVTGASSTNYVVTNGTGRLGHTVGTSAATYDYPLGDLTGTAEYSPVSLNFAANSVSRVVFVGVTDATHPNNGSVTDFISRYWMSALSDATGTYTYTPSFTYVASDVNGSTTNMVGNRWGGLTWTEPNATGTAASNIITYSTALDQSTGSLAATAEWTARNSRCTGTPSVSALSSSAPGPFCDNANTTLTLTTPMAETGFTYQWQNSILGTPGTFSNLIGETNPTYLATGTTTLYYQLIVTCSFSGLADTSAVLTVNVYPSPSIAITPSSLTSCGGSTVSLAATGGVSYVWSPNYNITSLTGTPVNVTPLVNTTYTVVGTDANGCSSSANVAIAAAPAVPTLTVTSSASPACIGNTVTLGAGTINPVTVLAESFNGTAPGWARTNNSTGGTTPAAAAWTQRSSGYVYGTTTFTTPDASAFYLSNSDEPGSGVSVQTYLTSPSFSLTGYSAASLSLSHFYRDNTAADTAFVQVSTNGITWSTVQLYNTTQGSATAFATPTISLNAYVGQSTVYVRFYYKAAFDWFWAINSATITGTMNYTYAWSSTPTNLNSTSAAPTALVSTSSVFQVVVTNAYGCTNSGSVSVTGVASAEANAGSDASVCGGGSYTFSGASAANQTSVLWTTSGLGTLSNATTLTPSYIPHVSEVGGAPVSFTLTANSNAPCSNATDVVMITFNALQNYYPDGDGDGYGSAASLPTQGCTAPVGFVANNTDQCDSDMDINPGTEWWLDADGDGFGGYIFDYGNVFSGCAYPDPDGAGPGQFIPYFPPVNGNQSYTADCNDTDPNFFPGIEVCNNVDDDCDGLIDEGGCAPQNDLIQNATVVQATNPISICTETTGTVAGATVSPEATSTVGAGGGQDVWYRFVASSPTLQIRVFNAVGFDPVIELRTGAVNSTTQVDVENTGTGNFETMAVSSLTVGQTYYYAVRSFGNTGGSAFKTCIGNFIPSGCLDSQSPIVALCQTFKFKSVGATNYTVTFTPAGGSVGGGTITTTSSFTTSNALLNLVPGSTYDVTIAANYSVTDAGGTTQIITRNSANPSCTVTVSAHQDIAVRTSQWCSAPATLLRSTFMRTDPFVCGVTNYTYEFTPVVSCSNNTATGIPFTYNNNARLIQLNFPGTATSPSGQTIQQFTHYRVRVRPNFGPGGMYPGTWGNASTIYIGGTLMTESDEAPAEMDSESLSALALEPLLYPNPNNGQSVFLEQEEWTAPITEVDVFDGLGRLVYNQQLSTEGTMQLELLFEEPLKSGIYLVRVKNGSDVRTAQMVVTR